MDTNYHIAAILRAKSRRGQIRAVQLFAPLLTLNQRADRIQIETNEFANLLVKASEASH